MRLRDLQQILEKFTNGQKGTMISDCPVYIETQSGHLEDVRRIEVQESAIIGDPNPARLVLKADSDNRIRSIRSNKVNYVATMWQYLCQHKRNFGGINFFFYTKKVRGTRGTGVFLDYKCWYQ